MTKAEDDANTFAVCVNVFSHPVVGIHRRSFTETEAWLFLMANPDDPPTHDRPLLHIFVEPNFLAKRWKWSRDDVDGFLKRLSDAGMLTYAVWDTRNGVSTSCGDAS